MSVTLANVIGITVVALALSTSAVGLVLLCIPVRFIKH